MWKTALVSLITNKPVIAEMKDIDRAAFFMTIGGKYDSLKEKYPENVFVVYIRPWMLFWEKFHGYVPYRKFCHNRHVLKRAGRLAAGLPAHFTGQPPRHLLKDIATFRRFTKTEQSLIDKNP